VGYTAVCGGAECEPTTYAYVCSSLNDFKIYLCNSYWTAPQERCTIDSKPGTIIHELSHFDILANTDDNAYGTDAAQILADTDPVGATQNADNHEYFAESCPSLTSAGRVFFTRYKPALNRGILPAVAGLAPKTAILMNCLKGDSTVKCNPLAKRVQRTFQGENYAFHPSAGNVTVQEVLAASTIIINFNPATATEVYLYAAQWPPGNYTFLAPAVHPVAHIQTGDHTYYHDDTDVLTVPIGQGKAFNGILKFPTGITQIKWRGVPKNAQATLRYTLAWVEL